MSPTDALLGALLVLVAGALLALLASSRRRLAGWVSFAATLAAGGLAAHAAVRVLLEGRAYSAVWVALPNLGSSLRVEVDGLTALFLLLIALISVVAAFYSISYMDHYTSYGVAAFYPAVLLFVAGMYGIVSTTDLMLGFFALWQLMTVPSYFLVRFEHRRPENRRSANRYLLMMELSCFLVMAGAFVLGRQVSVPHASARFDFGTLAEVLPDLLLEGGATVPLAFLLFVIGFGIKAGMWPFGQLWLPDAHPAAPSPVSALLSGVMIKTGVYGLIRTLLWLPPAEARFPSGSWGMAVATLGAVTLFVGTAQALKQEHTKRLLAFHSIGQVGYILLGLGACVALAGGLSVEARSLALLGLIGALFHTFNHATFKSLLFLNAGAILSATDTQDINRLGGLMRHMPVTGWTALVASLSIAGVPAFNGFASKWSIFVASVLASPHQRGLVLLGLVAILTSALTLASFLKFYGMTFLSRSSHLVRERSAARSLEVDALMKAPQVLLAALCVVVGLVPGPVLRVLARSIPDHSLALVSALGVASLPSGTLQVSVVGNGQAVAAVLFPAAFFALLAALLLFSRWVSRLGGARRREAPVWLCGYLPESDETRYRAHGLYGEIKGYVGWVGGRGPAGAHPAPARDASPHEKE